MPEYVTVLGLAALPAAANVLGGLLGDLVTLPRRVLNLVFEWVAGMLLGVVGIELMPRVLHASIPWLMVLVFVLGAGLHHPIDVAESDLCVAIGVLVALVVAPALTRLVLPLVPERVLEWVAAPEQKIA